MKKEEKKRQRRRQRRRRTKRRWKSDKDRNGGVDVIGFIRSRTKRIIIRRQRRQKWRQKEILKKRFSLSKIVTEIKMEMNMEEQLEMKEEKFNFIPRYPVHYQPLGHWTVLMSL